MTENVKLTLHPERAASLGPAAAPEGAAASPQRAQITDDLGRTLALRELEVLEEQDLIGLIGEPLCMNRLYMTRVFEACRVAAIDGEPVDIPLTPAQLRVVLKRLNKHGLEAVMREGQEQLKRREAERVALAKKSQGTPEHASS